MFAMECLLRMTGEQLLKSGLLAGKICNTIVGIKDKVFERSKK